ncbi:MAG: hypothetical protein H0X27_04445 [Caulobacteraceae bacterium]|nr:hypothetical protein [Caulobacteraceae bacterium]
MVTSIFIVGLVKSGSTLLNRIMRPLCQTAGLRFSAPANDARQRGIELADVEVTFEPEGQAYGGFRNLPWPLPDFAANRTVFLVRDPRDALTSLYYSVAYSHGAPGSTDGTAMLERFERRRAKVRAMTIDAFVLGEAAALARLIEKTLGRLPAHRRYRYEDVIFDKQAWALDMLGYLGLSVSERRVAKVVGRNDLVPAREDPQAHIRRVTPGDHRAKLQARTIAGLDDRLAGVLERLGYGPAARA